MAPPQESSSSPGRSRWWSLSVASVATLIVTLDTGQLSIALPLIIREFNADLALASWMALVYALITASLYLPCGRMSDLFGLGKLFLGGFILYSLSSIRRGGRPRRGAADFLPRASSRRQRADHGEQFCLGHGAVSAGGARPGDGYRRRHDFRARIFAGPGDWRPAYSCFRLALQFLSVRHPGIGGLCCGARAAAAGEFSRLESKERSRSILSARSVSR